MCCLRLLSYYIGQAEQMQQKWTGLQALTFFLPGPLQSLHAPYLRDRSVTLRARGN